MILLDDDELLYRQPLGEKKTVELEAMLRNKGCFSPSFSEADPYSIETYIVQRAYSRTETTFILDRNVYSQVLALAKGRPVNESSKTAAGIMAFASCAQADFEPAIALYEGSASGVTGGWRRDLALFRAADAIDPINWASLALGVFDRYTKHIRRKAIPPELSGTFDPSKKLKAFDFTYPILLKVAVLTQTVRGRSERMLELLRFMYEAWQFSAPALYLALILWSDRPPKRVFKNIGCKDRDAALGGVKNAAWDLVYITEWNSALQKQAERNRLYVLCSQDAALLKVAHLIKESAFGVTLSSAAELFAAFGCNSLVVEKYEECLSALNSARRALSPWPENFLDYREKLIIDLELQLRRLN